MSSEPIIRFPTPRLPSSEYLAVPGSRGHRQKQLKQQQKEAEKSAKAAAKEAEKAAKVREKEVGKQQAAWERGQREREKAVCLCVCAQASSRVPCLAALCPFVSYLCADQDFLNFSFAGGGGGAKAGTQ